MPETHVWPTHVEDVVVSEARRSAPHCRTVVLPLHTVAPGIAPAQSESMGPQLPWLSPMVVSQYSPGPQRGESGLRLHRPPLQTRGTLEWLPLQAKAAAVEHGHPSRPTAPVPASTEQGLPS
jgi:hypothetical protein